VYSFQLTKNIIGIDIGTYSLKIAQVQRAGEKVALLNYEIIRFPKPAGPSQTWSRQEISAFIQHTLKELGIRTSDVVSEVTGPWTVARHLFILDLADDEMREAIRWGAKSDFPFSLEEAIIDFYKLDVVKQEEGAPKAEIISAVATRQVVEEQVALLKEAGLKPVFLSIPPFDLMQAYRITQPSPWTETAAVIDLGHKNARIIVLKNGKLKFSREFAVAGEAFTQALIGSYEINGLAVEVDESLAERIKIKSGLLEEWEADQMVEGFPQDQIQKRLRPVMDRLILELERSLNYYKTEFKDYEVKRILLTGGGSLLKGLPGALEMNLEIPIQAIQDVAPLTLKKKMNEDLFLKNLPFLTPVLGLVTQGRPFINLSPTFLIPQVRERSVQNYLKPVLVGVLLLGLILGFGIPTWNTTREIARLQRELTAKKGQMARMGKPVQELARMEQEEILLNKSLEGLPRIKIKRLPLGDLFQELSRLVPSNMSLTNFQFSKSQETPLQPEFKVAPSKSLPVTGKSEEPLSGSSKEEGKGDYQLMVQGVVFGSDQEIMVTLSDFTEKLNRSGFFKEAKVHMTLKSTEFIRAAAEFKVFAKLAAGPSLPGKPLPRSPA
jgi:type IV pilus assembly protein PilM